MKKNIDNLLRQNFDLNLTSYDVLQSDRNIVVEISCEPNNRFVLKMYPIQRGTRQQTTSEWRLVQFVIRNGFTIPTPVQTLSSKTCFEAIYSGKPYICVLMKHIDGNPIDAGDQRVCRNWGSMIARLHLALDTFPNPGLSPHDARYLISRPIHALQTQLSLPLSVKHLLKRIEGRLVPIIERLPKLRSTFGICHGDMQPRHAIMSNGEIYLLDFDSSCLSWRIYEFGSMIRSLGEDSAAWKAFYSGYVDSRPLESWELAHLPTACIVRTLWEVDLALQLQSLNQMTAETRVMTEEANLIRWLAQVESVL